MDAELKLEVVKALQTPKVTIIELLSMFSQYHLGWWDLTCLTQRYDNSPGLRYSQSKPGILQVTVSPGDVRTAPALSHGLIGPEKLGTVEMLEMFQEVLVSHPENLDDVRLWTDQIEQNDEHHHHRNCG